MNASDVEEVQIKALKREGVIQKWKLKNLKQANQKLLHDIKNAEREAELFDLQKSKLQLEIALLQTNLNTIIDNSANGI